MELYCHRGWMLTIFFPLTQFNSSVGVYWTGNSCPENMKESWMDARYNCIGLRLQLGKGMRQIVSTGIEIGDEEQCIRAVQM